MNREGRRRGPVDLPQRGTLRAGLFLLFWTLIGLSFASQLYLASSKAGRPVTWGQAVGGSLADWYVWAGLSIPIVQLARRFRFDSPGWGRHVGIHLAGAAVFSVVYIFIRAVIGQAQGWLSGSPVRFADAFGWLLVNTFQFDVMIYWVIVSVSHAVAYYRQYQERALRATELESRLTQARLQALQMQLNPHFLFNTLNAISTLMHRDVKAADRMLTRLGELLRYALDSTEAQEVPLRQELEFLDRYLEIERTRFGARLTVERDVDPDTLEIPVPNLILQPLVENAIKHGIERKSRAGAIRLRARLADGMLHLEVRDNGPGLDAERPRREGIGLANTRARLWHLYGDRHRFELRNAPEGGTLVEMAVPVAAPAGARGG